MFSVTKKLTAPETAPADLEMLIVIKLISFLFLMEFHAFNFSLNESMGFFLSVKQVT